MKNFDIIGDIHGYATALTLLLKKLGYRKVKNTYRHDENRMVLFLGDYIDRGLEEESTCNIVRAMVESGDALAIQGNHEYNAICFATEHNGGYLRTHNERNIKTHENFLKEYPLGSKKHKDIISWFKTLPLFLELDDLRAVHACWHKDSINFLKNNLNSNIKLLEKCPKLSSMPKNSSAQASPKMKLKKSRKLLIFSIPMVQELLTQKN